MKYTLHDYQEDLVARARQRLVQGVRRLLLQLPTGGGKTLVSSEIIRLAVARGRRILFLAHMRSLVDQKSKKLTDFGVDHGVLMSGVSARPWLPVQVGSRDTLLSRSVRNAWHSLPDADIVICDEAHHVPSDSFMNLLQRYPQAIHLGLTATPARSDGRGLGGFYEALECGPPASRLIRDGVLVPVRCFAPQAVAGKGEKRKLHGDPVSNWLKYAEGRPTVLFAPNIKASRALVTAFNMAGITAEHLDSHSSDEERQAVVRRVEEGKTQVLSNCTLISEGVDIPVLSCCQMVRTCGSYVFFSQALGRVMRAHRASGKKDAILIDHSDAVIEHGFPDEDVRWSLDEGETVESRNKKDRKEEKRSTPICCPQCGFLFQATIVCPSCGHSLPRKAIPPKLREKLLCEVSRNLNPEQAAAADYQSRLRFWHSCLAVAARRNANFRMALAMYRSKWKEWPGDDFPNVPRGTQCERKVAEVCPQYVNTLRGAV